MTILIIIIIILKIQMEPRNFLPWILSAMVHSVIIYGLYGMHGTLDLDAPGGVMIIHDHFSDNDNYDVMMNALYGFDRMHGTIDIDTRGIMIMMMMHDA